MLRRPFTGNLAVSVQKILGILVSKNWHSVIDEIKFLAISAFKTLITKNFKRL